MKKIRKAVLIKKSVVESILSYFRATFPEEGILLLRGRISKESVEINEVLIPPFATHGEGFSSFPTYMLPLDLSIVGVAHSHPSSNSNPSMQDLSQMYGKLMIIVTYPFRSEHNLTVYDKEGNPILFSIV